MKLLVLIEPIVETQQPPEYEVLDGMPLIHGKPWIEHVLESLPRLDPENVVLVVCEVDPASQKLTTLIQAQRPRATVKPVPGRVHGFGCAALMAGEHLLDDELFVVQGNQILRQDVARIFEPVRAAGYDAGVVVFDSLDTRWPHVRLNSHHEVEEASETALIGPHALAGVYFYRCATDFLRSLERTIRKGKPSSKGYGLAPAVNEMILAGKRIGSAQIAAAEFVPMERDADIECCCALIPGPEPSGPETAKHTGRRAAEAA
jgi:dTDP-glucose pyrophosphorylase